MKYIYILSKEIYSDQLNIYLMTINYVMMNLNHFIIKLNYFLFSMLNYLDFYGIFVYIVPQKEILFCPLNIYPYLAQLSENGLHP